MCSFAICSSGSAVVLPDGRCDIIMRNYASTMDEVTPVITRPATQSYPVDYDTGDEWLGIRLRPEHGVALWWGDLDNATDSVFGRSEVLDRLPSLAVLHETDRTSDALAHIIPIRTWPDVDPRLTSAIDILHASGGRLRIDALTKFMAFYYPISEPSLSLF